MRNRRQRSAPVLGRSKLGHSVDVGIILCGGLSDIAAPEDGRTPGHRHCGVGEWRDRK